MAIYLAVLAVANVGLGFGLAVYLARKYRALGRIDDGQA
jgi:hypothetical protein